MIRQLCLAVALLVAGVAAGTSIRQAPAADTPALTALKGSALKVAIADESFWPFHETNAQGKTEGFDADIASALCAKMEVKCTFVTASWDDTIPHLIQKKYDFLVTAMEATASRRQVVDFTIPYAGDPWKLLAKQGAAFPITKEGLSGRTIGIQRTCPTWDGKAENFLRSKFGKGARIKVYDVYARCPSSGLFAFDEKYQKDSQANYDRMIADLDQGRIDLVFDSKLSMHWSGLTERGARVFVGPDFFDYMDGSSIAVRKREPKLLDALNAAIKAIRVDGTYQTIMARYFPFEIYGG